MQDFEKCSNISHAKPYHEAQRFIILKKIMTVDDYTFPFKYGKMSPV